MRGIIIFFFLIHLVYSFDAQYDGLWKSYQIKHGRTYSASEENIRRSIWEDNAKMIALHNLEADQGLQHFRMELNKFSDKTNDELRASRECVKVRNGLKQTKEDELYEPKCGKSCISQLPKFVDWRKKGYVTEVKDQKDCGSCWAFSSTGSLEGQVKAKTGKLVSLSEQNLIDCSSKEGNEGCDGGWMEYAFQYVIDNEGIDTERAYPYEAIVSINTYLLRTSFSFLFFRSGVFHDRTCSKDDLDHAVLVVGYGSKNKSDYWIVKNSWGSDWGMDGYILMARNQHNQCGIATDAVYPIV
ncbi:procathepsin L [Parasteatoda tepidariorum]|uniref:procathepsin L n=1 Tax=Parasteatoda tepidariorum TaxID=114398 RepID=UPI0039BD6E57